MDMVQKKQPITLSDFLKNRILWKVYVLWFARRIVPLMLLQVAVIVVSLKLFGDNVFVSKVLQNIGVVSGDGYWQVFKYLVAVFAQTRLIVQAVVVLALGVVALLLRDVLRSIFTYRSLWRRKE
ncbi:MAG: hypothetical protein A3H63_01525 [Candidatus Harrisonbacteria bacterium RIFCSPLOWO2_02_FULL_45_10c]|uniref:Uncharacterized protein n=1 Tax=Candidatus Harrisonbacteria bacterium RIFCSPLOWO2_02_FULL_45_10c TaxID=1798410 RepID=A0A1G1ZRQ1_9BACT|nr:MAG: hypothetical protein A3H63_01525 [Candidatus Harrisonbacteria bacterium RIFCSPLOWO2_02_FULL_45_10c]